MSAILSAVPPITVLASTGAAGTALVNGTPTIVSYAVPNDGGLHSIIVAATQQVTSPETGGAVTAAFTFPDGTASTLAVFSGGSGAGDQRTSITFLVKAGTTFAVNQTSALTLGAATVWVNLIGA